MKECRVWMPLRGYRVDAESPALEEQLWNFFPRRCVAFWPWMLRDADALNGFLERAIPVKASTKMGGFGRFETTLRWLVPWVKVEWRGRVWCISREGRMWDAEGQPAPDAGALGPVWRLANLEDSEQPPPSGVVNSPVPAGIIAGFLDEYQEYPWFKFVKEIVWDRRAGMDLFRMKVEREGQSLEVLLQRAKYDGQDVGAALEKVFSKLSKEGGSHRVDATYEGKILVKSLSGGPDGPKEGSRKQ